MSAPPQAIDFAVPPVKLLLGCTAVGKSEVAIGLAPRLNAEILSIDSMQVYRRMDIGTAKPTAEMRRAVPHHLLDLVEPHESFSVAKFVESADAAIADVRRRERTPLLVAGTPFYLMSVLYGLFEGPPADAALRRSIRARAQTEGIAALHAELRRVDPAAAERIHPNDLMRIERALEVHAHTGRPISELQRQWSGPPRHVFQSFGLRRRSEDLASRINARVKAMIAEGLEKEVRGLLAEPSGMSPQARAALGYAEMIEHVEGRLSLDDAVERIKINTRRFAKSQRTWFRRFRETAWIDVAPADGVADIVDRLADAAARAAAS